MKYLGGLGTKHAGHPYAIGCIKCVCLPTNSMFWIGRMSKNASGPSNGDPRSQKRDLRHPR